MTQRKWREPLQGLSVPARNAIIRRSVGPPPLPHAPREAGQPRRWSSRWALQFASPALQADKDVVLAAVAQTGRRDKK